MLILRLPQLSLLLRFPRCQRNKFGKLKTKKKRLFKIKFNKENDRPSNSIDLNLFYFHHKPSCVELFNVNHVNNNDENDNNGNNNKNNKDDMEDDNKANKPDIIRFSFS